MRAAPRYGIRRMLNGGWRPADARARNGAAAMLRSGQR